MRLGARGRGVPALAALAALAASALPVAPSTASFNSRTQNPGNIVAADSPANYAHLWSQASDPAGLTGYATRRNAVPARPAASGADAALAVDLGGYKNVNAVAVPRVLTLQAPSALPAAPRRSPSRCRWPPTPRPAASRSSRMP